MNNQFITSFLETIKMGFIFNMRSQPSSFETMGLSLIFIIITYVISDEIFCQRIGTFITNIYYRKYYSILLEGKRCFKATEYNTRSDQLFSNRFNAVWYFIAKNINENKSIHCLKEFADSSNIYDENGQSCNYSQDNSNTIPNVSNNFKDIFIVNQLYEFSLTDKIFCKVTTSSERHERKSGKNTVSDVEIIKLNIFSYIVPVGEIQLFIDKLTQNYILEIQNTRINKRFIYSLLGQGNKEDEVLNKYKAWEECEFISSRKFDNLFFEEKDSLIHKINFFNKNRDWYEKEGHPWTLGLGLSGPPGTGKTSIIKCIANMLNRHLIVIPLNKIKTQREFSQYYFENRYNRDNNPNSINFDNKIIVFEDIDCMSDIVKTRGSKCHDLNSTDKLLRHLIKKVNKQTKNMPPKIISKQNHKEEEDIDEDSSDISIDSDYTILNTPPTHDTITLSFILNIIDGLRETPGRILIITSNKYEELDQALIRPGRIDYTLKMNNASLVTLNNMFEHYYHISLYECLDKSHDKLKELLVDFVLSPADIVNIRLHSDTPEIFVDNMFNLLQDRVDTMNKPKNN
jgi:hypothetical protein